MAISRTSRDQPLTTAEHDQNLQQGGGGPALVGNAGPGTDLWAPHHETFTAGNAGIGAINVVVEI